MSLPFTDRHLELELEFLNCNRSAETSENERTGFSRGGGGWGDTDITNET